MKKLKLSFLSSVILLVAVLANLSFTLPSPADELPKLNILVERTADGLKLSSKQGTAWLKTSFSLEVGKSQAINQYGMAEVEKEYRPKDEKLADFLFVITRTEKGFSYKGLRGTAWKTLAYESSSEGCRHLISEEGVEGLN